MSQNAIFNRPIYGKENKRIGGFENAKLTVTVKEANRIDATVYLQKNSSGSWKNVKMWSKSVYGTDTMSFIRSASVKKGKYRAKATVSVSKGAKTETNTIYMLIPTG